MNTQIIVKFNEDGTIDFPASEAVAQWCAKHKKGIIIAIGDCDDPAWQHINFLDHKEVLKDKKARMAKAEK